MQKDGKENIKNIIKNKGYKCTPARIHILQVFFENKTPLDAEKIYKILSKKKETRDINEATIYRTVSSFAEKEILKRIDLRKDSVHFELNNDHHHHIVCTKCNLIESFYDCKMEKLLERIVENSPKFKNIKEHSFELFGVCKDCLLKVN